MKTSLKLEKAYLKENNNSISSEEENFIKNSNKEVLNKYSFSKIKNNIMKEKETFYSSVVKLVFLNKQFYIPAFAAVLIVLFFPLRTFLGGNEIVRVKGSETGLSIYKKVGNGFSFLKNDSFVHSGDVLQLSYYVNEEFKHGLIVSIDGNNKLTKHFPENNDGDTSLVLNRNVVLSNSFELDNAPKFEKFYFIISKSKMDIRQIINAISESRDESLSSPKFSNLYINVVNLRKE